MLALNVHGKDSAFDDNIAYVYSQKHVGILRIQISEDNILW